MEASAPEPAESAPGEEVIQMKGEQEDNAAAADADTTSDNSPTFCARVKQMWPLLVCAALETCFGVVRGVTFLSFIRTTINCDPDTPDGFDKTSSSWSGSDYCADRCQVVEDAQLIKGIADGTEFGLQCLCLPALGFLGDVIGRKPLLICSLTGLSISLAIMSLAAFIETGTTVTVLIIVASALKGSSECGFAGVLSMVADSYDTVQERGASFALLQANKLMFSLVGAGTALAILSLNLSHYYFILLVLSLCALMAALLSACIVKETIADENRRVWSWSEANPCVNIRILLSTPYITTIASMVIFFIASFAIFILFQAFMIAAYSFTQTATGVVLVGVAIMGGASSAFSMVLIKKFGNRKVLLGGLSTATLGAVVLVASPYSIVFFFIGLVLYSVATTAVPAFQGLFSKQVNRQNQAKLQGA